MFRSPWELDVQARYQRERIANEQRSRASVERSDAATGRTCAHLRRRVGIALMRLGAAIAGGEARRSVSGPVFGVVSPAIVPPAR